MVISTNVPVKLDGNPYSSAKEPGDSGVAVYFDLNGQNRCYPIDRWDRVADNLWAIAKSIEALRGLDRWGAKNSIEAAFTGFLALPGPTVTAIRYFDACVDEDDVVATRRKLVKELHPDAGGDADKFAEMERQFKEITRKGRVNR